MGISHPHVVAGCVSKISVLGIKTLKRKCDLCDQPATHHSVEIIKGQKIEKHLCENHAVETGMGGQVSAQALSKLLPQLGKLHNESGDKEDVTCSQCGMTFMQFREVSLMGCPHCYEAFEQPLEPLLERAHEGASHHIGKVPRRAGDGQERQLLLMRMRKRLTAAVEAEDYELAVRIRDDIKRFEDQLS